MSGKIDHRSSFCNSAELRFNLFVPLVLPVSCFPSSNIWTSLFPAAIIRRSNGDFESAPCWPRCFCACSHLQNLRYVHGLLDLTLHIGSGKAVRNIASYKGCASFEATRLTTRQRSWSTNGFTSMAANIMSFKMELQMWFLVSPRLRCPHITCR
jgi:hypothetical protein